MGLIKRHIGNLLTIYGITFGGVWLCLSLYPPSGGYIWDPLFINVNTSLLFTILVALTGRLIGTDNTWVGLIFTALFLIFFCPGAERFFNRDEVALLELATQCMVPFFISQYMSISEKSFGRLYFLMLLMGIFCSYTHNSITIPLCATFVWLSFIHRRQFFGRACWPMVVDFVIGTGLSIWNVRSHGAESWESYGNVTKTATVVFHTLWDTKAFVLAMVLTACLLVSRRGRKLILRIGHRQYVLSICLLMSWVFLPFAPLGIDNAITGICFFSMLWALTLCQHLILIHLKIRL